MWQDDFNGNSLNPKYWTIADNFVHDKQELNIYNKDQVKVSGGNLILTTSAGWWRSDTGKVYRFASGWVDTKFKKDQRFGKFTIRAKLPNPDANGIWPAHCNEI